MTLPRRLARNHEQKRLDRLVRSKILRLCAPHHVADFAAETKLAASLLFTGFDHLCQAA
jgi:hypothetical protein